MLRNPLSSISSNRQVRRQYNTYERGLICGAVASGVTPYRIQKNYGVSESSTRSIVSNALIRHNSDFKPRFERLKKLIIRDERHILRIIKRNFKITYKNLIIEIEV